jgi:hypothetical protein
MFCNYKLFYIGNFMVELRMIGAYGIVQVFAQDVGIETNNFLQTTVLRTDNF